MNWRTSVPGAIFLVALALSCPAFSQEDSASKSQSSARTQFDFSAPDPGKILPNPTAGEGRCLTCAGLGRSVVSARRRPAMAARIPTAGTRQRVADRRVIPSTTARAIVRATAPAPKARRAHAERPLRRLHPRHRSLDLQSNRQPPRKRIRSRQPASSRLPREGLEVDLPTRN